MKEEKKLIKSYKFTLVYNLYDDNSSNSTGSMSDEGGVPSVILLGMLEAEIELLKRRIIDNSMLIDGEINP